MAFQLFFPLPLQVPSPTVSLFGGLGVYDVLINKTAVGVETTVCMCNASVASPVDFPDHDLAGSESVIRCRLSIGEATFLFSSRFILPS